MITKYPFPRHKYAYLTMLRSEAGRSGLKVGDYVQDSKKNLLYQILEKNPGHNPDYTSFYMKEVLDLPHGKRPDYIY